MVVLLAWRDGALNVSPVAKLRAQQSPRRTAAHSTDRVRRKTVSALVHFFCAFSLFLFVRLFFSVFFSVPFQKESSSRYCPLHRAHNFKKKVVQYSYEYECNESLPLEGYMTSNLIYTCNTFKSDFCNLDLITI